MHVRRVEIHTVSILVYLVLFLLQDRDCVVRLALHPSGGGVQVHWVTHTELCSI